MSFGENIMDSKQEGASENSNQDSNVGSVNESINTSSEWYIDKNGNIKGSGAKPEWLKDNKYTDVFKQAEAYPHSERKISELTQKLKEIGDSSKKAPESYEFKIPEEFEELISDDDKHLNSFIDESSEILKTANVDQETFEKISSLFLNYLDKNYKDAQTYDDGYIKEEIGKIGPDAKQQYSDMKTWLSQAHPNVDADKLLKNINSAEQFLELKKMRDGSKTIPISQKDKSNETSYDQLKKDIISPRMLHDDSFRNKTISGYEKLFGKNN